MITPEQLEILADIFSNTDEVSKITLKLDPVSRSIVVSYEDLDDEWFRELTESTDHGLTEVRP
jgi:hypothetical protein